MKYKLTIVIVITVLVLALGVCETIFLNKTFNRFEQKLDNIIEQESYSLEDIEELAVWWRKKSEILEFTIPHLQLTEVTVTIGELKGAVEGNDLPSASALLTRIKSYSTQILHMYRFTVNNII